jgi:glucose/arabinose dehydrogenase
MEEEVDRAAVHEIDLATRGIRLFASGLRNPNGLSWNPESGELWVVVNERDEIGSDLVPDYMTSVRDGGFYGWPYSYFGQHVDERVEPQNPELVAKAIKPDYALGPIRARSASHSTKAICSEMPSRTELLSGSTAPGSDGRAAFGRPVGVAIDRKGALLVADDVGNRIWWVAPQDSSRVCRCPPHRPLSFAKMPVRSSRLDP